MTAKSLLLGQTLSFRDNPFKTPIDDAVRYESSGGVLIQDGRISAVGPGDILRRDHPDAEITDMGDALLTAGFVDAHALYPQTAIIASWGKRLID